MHILTLFSLGRRSANRRVCRLTGGLRGPVHQRQVRRKPYRPTDRGSSTRVCPCLKSACQHSHFRRGFVSNTSRNTPQPDPYRHRYDRSPLLFQSTTGFYSFPPGYSLIFRRLQWGAVRNKTGVFSAKPWSVHTNFGARACTSWLYRGCHSRGRLSWGHFAGFWAIR